MKYTKLYKSIICLAIGAFSLSSCEDFLDRQEDEKLTFEKIWESRNTTRQYWLNAMSFLPNENGGFIGDNDPYLGASDECTIAYDRQYRWMNFGSWNPSQVPYYKMDHYYKGIRECNIFLQNVYKCSDPLATKDQLDEWYWQARFARAFYYFLMMRDYGPVFLLGDELLDFTASTEDLYRPRNTWDQCVDYVVSEMTQCAESGVILQQSDLPAAKWGLATIGTCHAVISRLLLYSARPLFNGNELYKNMKNPATADFPELSGVNLFPDFNADKWKKAAEAAKKLIDNSCYKLYRAGNDNPYEDYYGITHETWNSELIWTDRYNGLFSWGVGTAPTGVAGTAYGAVGPTQKLVDAYAMKNGWYPITGYNKDGSPIVEPSSGYDLDAELEITKWNYPAQGWSNFNNFDIDAPNMYKEREPRFYVTFFFVLNFGIHGNSSTHISFAKNGNGNKSHDYPKGGYLCNRFYDHKLNSAEGQWGNITFPVFRLGEIYLNFIEAVLECKRHNVALDKSYETLAWEKWDDLRNRAGMESIKQTYGNASIEQLIELCHRERQVELAFERHRYFDTRTWMIATETDNGDMYGMNTTCPLDNGMAGTETPAGFWKRTVFETRVFQDRHYLYPFSQRELDRNKLLTQNYGW